MGDRIRTVLKFVKGLSILGLTAIVSRVAQGTLENLLMQDVGPAVMVLFRRVAYGIRDFFGGMFAGRGVSVNPVYEQAA
ncbi:MAG: hypothetical protein PHI24_15095 [Desulfitobacteriaceae bacterium]|nr:hypothetical protein [Desulfitobacteriaceae bacterium]